MNLLAFCGPKQVGKSTARTVCFSLAQFPVSMSFAGPLKLALRAMGLSHHELFDDKEAVIPDIGKTPRQLMQTLGTEWGRHMVHQDFWLKMFSRHYMQQARNGTDLIVVDDVRYDNEARHIRSLGGTIIQLTSTVRGIHSDAHSSEAGISRDLVDHVVVNDGDREQFSSDIKLIVIPLLKP